MEINIQHFKEKLEEEKKLLEKELSGVGRVSPTNKEDWEPTPGDFNNGTADPNEVADRVEEYEARTAIEAPLENNLNDVKRALERIKAGTYGLCKIDNVQIENERLEANPAAETCKVHIND